MLKTTANLGSARRDKIERGESVESLMSESANTQRNCANYPQSICTGDLGELAIHVMTSQQTAISPKKLKHRVFLDSRRRTISRHY
jgi:hypothetical protein